ncbi:single-strand DNA-binding protein [Streptomyces sp. DvalAA-14]|uniref:single-stranded DNA-binding protein n=1 Tax=unclassified Streptomyces TaxID=2593676 RepID=UPI00081B36F5|nr:MULTISPECIES: single-stranded DNA-binding protein [unclassified Streptomyces]MYS24850.1 single-stranded DNA-binding protein [Streptomyces sp. SID4948]SCE49920.1 single-strand DNA-binding protein [Streptomyces sp. DvalAA-14]
MNETLVTVVGNVATEPETHVTATGVPMTRFRLATTARRWDAERGGWTDGSTSFFTVRAWRNLAGNVKESIGLGEPLLVQGRLRIREEEKDGRRYLSAEIEAVSVGHDLSRGLSRFTRGAPAPAAARGERTDQHRRTEPAAPEPPPAMAPVP